MKILLIEDDSRIAYSLKEVLEDHRYVVEVAGDGQLGFELACMDCYDLILLDLMLPKLDGVTVCQRLRHNQDSTPILMLTAKDSSTDEVMGLDAGADDYVVKPFQMKALLARIRALLRRNATILPPVLTWEKLTLDPSKCEVYYNEQRLSLTPKEYSILELFLRQGDRVLSRRQIIEQLWTFEDTPGEETVKVHLRSLRRKLKLTGAPANFIETVYGLGYRLNPEI
ncbi:response regulator transcription factor [Spirulina sp. CS-785/01]|uniref:response regulator transcription factor n=1 Tax=Spirulina sp. CS-785/01 TaxID=3021716 RepID=UPI00232B7412|nr:response regulator transcription factor [Spirulina sp. CS-785/01]MDB9314853.1 response regulator transcription factor [Spirulina sp. CS-785/01]